MKQELKLLDGEYWWGGIVADGYQMPMGDETLQRDLRTDQLSNQTAPFLASNKGRYIYGSEPFIYAFENRILTIESEAAVTISEGHKTLRGAYLAAAEKHFPASGTTPDPLLFTAPQYNAWIEMMYEPTGDKMVAYAQSILDNGMPPGVIMIDDNWQEDYGVWTFHEGRFPEPKKTIDALHALGFKVMLWVCNYISPDSYTFRELEKLGYLIQTRNGDSAIVHWWNGYSGILDLTNPDACAWLKRRLDTLVKDYGIDGFKFDAGDPDVYMSDFVTHRTVTGTEYCKLWAQFGEQYALNEFRACYDMGGRALVQRLCDKRHAWDNVNGVASLIPNGLAQGIMGYAYNCPDMIGGGEYSCFLDNPDLDEELIVRFAQCAALFPMMQFSVSPWRILSKEHLACCVAAANLHKKLGGEILQLARHAAQTGEPITRYMEYVFPGCGYEHITDQFMLGDDILVAPVVTKKTYRRTVVFPAGNWQGEGYAVTGPCTKELSAPIDTLLWFKKVSGE